MTTPIIIIGAGGFGGELAEYLEDAIQDGAPYRFEGFIDDRAEQLATTHPELPILGTVEDLSRHPKAHILIAVGDPAARSSLADRLEQEHRTLATLVHPTAYVARSANIQGGTILCPFSLVGAHASVGRNVSVNVYASVGHDARIGEHSVISPYTAILGSVTLGNRCFTGAHATVAPGVNIAHDSKVAAGSVVSVDLPPGSLAVGNPARGRAMFKAPTA
jgi:sugar O-acyltransferase (sialic acid O-acetyltransferase NeuD family)